MAKTAPEFPYAAYREAVASEIEDRELAFIGLDEDICGVKCSPLTLRKISLLKVAKSPFILGGNIETLHIVQFLWIVSKRFCMNNAARDEFMGSILELECEKAVDEINEYIDRAFLDIRMGNSKSRPLVSMCATIALEMAGEPFRMNWMEVMDAPLSVLFQLMKAKDINEGGKPANARSDKIRGQWLAEVNAFSREQKAKAEKRKKKGVKHG